MLTVCLDFGWTLHEVMQLTAEQFETVLAFRAWRAEILKNGEISGEDDVRHLNATLRGIQMKQGIHG